MTLRTLAGLLGLAVLAACGVDSQPQATGTAGSTVAPAPAAAQETKEQAPAQESAEKKSDAEQKPGEAEQKPQ